MQEYQIIVENIQIVDLISKMKLNFNERREKERIKRQEEKKN